MPPRRTSHPHGYRRPMVLNSGLPSRKYWNFGLNLGAVVSPRLMPRAAVPLPPAHRVSRTTSTWKLPGRVCPCWSCPSRSLSTERNRPPARDVVLPCRCRKKKIGDPVPGYPAFWSLALVVPLSFFGVLASLRRTSSRRTTWFIGQTFCRSAFLSVVLLVVGLLVVGLLCPWLSGPRQSLSLPPPWRENFLSPHFLRRRLALGTAPIVVVGLLPQRKKRKLSFSCRRMPSPADETQRRKKPLPSVFSSHSAQPSLAPRNLRRSDRVS